jgi:hypothetical protein
LAESLQEKWENKVIHGQYIRSIDKHLISEEDTFLWLSKGDLKAETESEIVNAQDQVLQTKYHATKILQTETSYVELTEWHIVHTKHMKICLLVQKLLGTHINKDIFIDRFSAQNLRLHRPSLFYLFIYSSFTFCQSLYG